MVLLSFVLNAYAETRFDHLLNLHQTGPLAAPARVPKEREYLCFGKNAPDLPLFTLVEGYATSITRFQASGMALNRMLGGLIVPLSQTQLPLFNGNSLGGRSLPANLIDSLRRQNGPGVYIALSVHKPTMKNLMAIFKIEPNQDLGNACSNSESIEYVCIENAAEG